ncbi:MAG: DUF4102 domain-containing protein [Proteobacteria bacterium]|nr:DUF4102 domain-containing protein [Pseudomonadota bacterium]MBI3495931.1 DUF4102 domain-containing protein [Pseudomonadota bacterium]
MPIVKLTKKVVDAVVEEPRRGKQPLLLWDKEVKGFGLLVTPAGTRSYIPQYRIGGRGTPTKRVTIGRHGSPWTPENAWRRL